MTKYNFGSVETETTQSVEVNIVYSFRFDEVGLRLITTKNMHDEVLASDMTKLASYVTNAAVAGCFFAVESVLWPSAADSTSSVTNTTSVVILSAVIASVVSEIGLGSDPAFKVPQYDFRSPSELPLYLLLGILCGLVSLALSRCTSYAKEAVDYMHETTGITKVIFPALGGLTVGLMALVYPEVLYWGFENVDILLESRPFVAGLPADILLQLVGVKIVATSLSRASGLVGGYYAPSLFIGAATGMAYGKFIESTFSGTNPLFQLHVFEVASPQAYGLVGMAATLAGVCQVPLTAVLLLFELTRDYRIVLPLLGAVGLSSLIASTESRKRNSSSKPESKKVKADGDQEPNGSVSASQSPANSTASEKRPSPDDLCDLESSLCVFEFETRNIAEKLTVSQAMRTTYVTLLTSMSLKEAIDLMLSERQSCAVVEKLLVSDICYLEGNKCRTQAATPSMTLLSAEKIMDLLGVSQLPVTSESTGRDRGGYVIGLLDKECIEVTCRAYAAKELLCVYDEAA
ncbi:hypothetical protein Taro_048785 [Colocasia esculenta]|uniref:Chloride channel protein n=1 Tax=Colocasia esculenta TaxID=4460 RepID=A0A843X939_COLES|nr:hypothetical protein [Colocasia esculenta]